MQPMTMVPISPAKALARATVLGAAALALAGCSMFGATKQMACPQAGILKDGARLVKFRPGPGRDLTDVVYEARISRLATGCEYNRRGVDVTMEVNLVAERGPASTGRRAQIPYFVAIMDPADAIVAKRTFSADMEFATNVNRAGVTERLEPKIPLPRGQSAARYKIVVGLQLTAEELAYNRRQQRIPGSFGARPLRPPLAGARTGLPEDPDRRPEDSDRVLPGSRQGRER